MPTPLPIVDRPIRLAVVGLGTISELALPPYAARDDVEVVALCDRDPARVARWHDAFPKAVTATDLDELLSAGAGEADVVDVLVPTPLHADVVCQVLEAGFHVQVQKPLARDLESADRMLAAADRTGAVLRVLEDYLFHPPLVKLKEVFDSGEIGEAAGIHMKIVATGRGGWEVPMSSYVWQFEQAADGRGMMVFDHGWHQLAVATWLLGPVERIFGWVGRTEIVPGIVMDAPSTLVWEHASGVRGVMDITFAPDTFFKSEHYTGDERVELTGTKGFVRCNRISAQGIQEPSVVVYAEGETRGYHAIPDRLTDSFDASTAHGLAHFRGEAPDLVMDGETARAVLATLICGLDSSEAGAIADVPQG